MNKHFSVALFLALLVPPASSAQVVVRISVAPPVLPVYVQPICPDPGYLWTPGYWSYGEAGYFWVPGVWVQPPSVGLLWTPGYWGFEGPVYIWHGGYWGPHIGFYGGVNYGFGYTGVGFLGGIWVGNVFRYNTAVMHVGLGFHDVYVDRAAIVEGGARMSFNGPGGLRARPTEGERMAERDHHVERTEMQRSHEHGASLDRSQRFSENHGRPANAAMSRPHDARAAGGNRPGEHAAAGRAGTGRPAPHAAEHSAAAGRAGAGHPAPHAAEHSAGAGRAGAGASGGRSGGAAPHANAARGNAAPTHANAAQPGRGGQAPGGAGHAPSKGAAPAAHASSAPKGGASKGGASKGGEHH